ncbi:hypothetical protein MTO96_035559 [Rhipicephalus appendiculatus]
MRASGSAQSTSSRGTLFARSEVIARDIRGAVQAKGASVKPETAPPERTRRSSETRLVASTSSYVAPDASTTPKITVKEVASDKPRVSNKSTLVTSASSSAVPVSRRASASSSAVTVSRRASASSSAVSISRRASTNAEFGTDTANRCTLTKDVPVKPQELVVSVTKATTDKRSLLVDATKATTTAWDMVRPSADSVNVTVQQATKSKTREAGPSESLDADAMAIAQTGGSDQLVNKNDSVTVEKLASTEAGLQPPPNVPPQSADTERVPGDDAGASATAEKGRNTASDVTPSAMKKGKDV